MLANHIDDRHILEILQTKCHVQYSACKETLKSYYNPNESYLPESKIIMWMNLNFLTSLNNMVLAADAQDYLLHCCAEVSTF